MDDRRPHVSFTGHRPPKLGGYGRSPVEIIEEASNRLKRLNPELAYTGMALGFDQHMGRLCVRLDIPFIAVVPFAGFELRWPREAQLDYHALLRKAKEVVVLHDTYRETMLQIRNEYLVDMLDGPSDVLLACWDGSKGGTFNCIQYAREQNKTIDIINPRVWRI